MSVEILDELAHRMEMKWGCDRLPALMPQAWRDKFDALKIQLDRVIMAGADTTADAEALAKAWRAMDAKATEQGSFPLPPACYSIRCDDGRIVEIAETVEHLRVLVWNAKQDGRDIIPFTLKDVANMLRAAGIVCDIKAIWPEATVAALPAEFRPGKRKTTDLDEEIPFGGDEVAA